jgi:hypothetical protein
MGTYPKRHQGGFAKFCKVVMRSLSVKFSSTVRFTSKNTRCMFARFHLSLICILVGPASYIGVGREVAPPCSSFLIIESLMNLYFDFLFTTGNC